MNLDRKLQYEILLYLQKTYPQEADLREMPSFTHDDFQPNAWYLSEHNLITPRMKRDNARPLMSTAKMTAKGLDFLAADGGLGAILNTVTVRFDVENVRQIFEENIIASALPETKKATLQQKLQGLSGDVLKSVMTDVIKEGLKSPTLLMTVADILARF